MIINNEQTNQYINDGYLLIKKCIKKEHINNLMKFVENTIRLEANLKETEGSSSYVLNDVLINLKKHNPSSSSWIYQTILNSFQLKKFFINIKLEDIVMQLLGMNNLNHLGVVSPAFRYDIPGDKRNVRTWHQDGNYFQENQDGNKHLVAWIPTTKATKENGSVIIAKGSHKAGKLDANYELSKGFSSEQYTAPKEQYKNYEHIIIEAEPGDIAFIHMDLLHSSGVNLTTDNVRYTAQIRFNSINSADYRPVFLRPEYPVYERNNKKVN